jgi:hypothetical protein
MLLILLEVLMVVLGELIPLNLAAAADREDLDSLDTLIILFKEM